MLYLKFVISQVMQTLPIKAVIRNPREGAPCAERVPSHAWLQASWLLAPISPGGPSSAFRVISEWSLGVEQPKPSLQRLEASEGVSAQMLARPPQSAHVLCTILPCRIRIQLSFCPVLVKRDTVSGLRSQTWPSLLSLVALSGVGFLLPGAPCSPRSRSPR